MQKKVRGWVSAMSINFLPSVKLDTHFVCLLTKQSETLGQMLEEFLRFFLATSFRISKVAI